MSLVELFDNSGALGGDGAGGRGGGREPAPGVMRFHRSMPGYAPSSVVDAPDAAAQLGLARLVVKLETERLGLPSFKVLGASWAICRALSRRAGVKPAATSTTCGA
jgi:threonine dehydratase